jgi:hypothetical protein
MILMEDSKGVVHWYETNAVPRHYPHARPLCNFGHVPIVACVDAADPTETKNPTCLWCTSIQ